MHQKFINHVVALTPKLPRATPQHQMSELRAALAEGWEIVQPIFARPLWSSLDDRVTAFHFVLQRERATKLLTVPQSRGIKQFIRERELTVDEPHGSLR